MRLLPGRRTIGGKVALAFLVTGLVTALVALGSVWESRRSGEIASKAYQETVIATSFARAVASDFGGMRAEAEHGLHAAPAVRGRTAKLVDALHASFLRDLGTAAASSDDPEVAETTTRLRAAEAGWLDAMRQARPDGDPADAIEDKAHEVEKGIDWLSYLVARKASVNRDNARATVESDMSFAIASAAAAFVICAVTSLLIARGLTGPLKTNLRFAEEVAAGGYDAEPPRPSNDEFGDLTRSVTTMRDKLVDALRSQEVLGKLSQERVGLALEGAADGVLVVAGDGTVQVANGALLRLLGIPPREFQAGAEFRLLVLAARRAGGDGATILLDASAAGEDNFERRLSGGGCVRISRRHTEEGALVAVLGDVSDERRQQDALVAAKSDLDGALANMSQGLAVFGPDGALRLSNDRFHELTGTSGRGPASGAMHADLAVAAARARGADARMAARFAAVEAAWSRKRGATKRVIAGEGFAMSVAQARMPDRGFILTIEDVTRQKEAESRVRFLADHDALTGLPNRTLMRANVEDALTGARRGRGFAYHALDLDHFKAVNDTMGHAAGDDLLAQVAGRLRACVRMEGVVARLGGDEFAILQPDALGDDGAAAVSLARRVIAALKTPFLVLGREVSIGASLGIAFAPRDGSTEGDIAIAADQALYQSKQDGRGTHTVFVPEMKERVRRRRDLEADLRSALASGQIELHYQPLLDAASMTIGGFEALMRWRHPRLGMVSPAEFIPIAEDSGIIRELGAWAMREACREAAGWIDDAYVAVNVSPVQLCEPRFKAIVLDALTKARLPAARLELEITESSLIKDPANTTSVMQEIRTVGVGFALDDFGTGYSSLSMLHAFPFTRIKVDRSFVNDLDAGRGAEQIVRAVTLLAKTLGMKVTAEGVETRRQLAFLEDIEVDVIQGWLIGRPVAAREVSSILDMHNKTRSTAA
ncbi:MAG: EAL domain-containing protein [Janthinobacterium lividum]